MPREFKNDIDAILALEGGDIDQDEYVAAFQKLIDSGVVWSLQGYYGRAAAALIEAGYCQHKDN